jgi:hypothetical protein
VIWPALAAGELPNVAGTRNLHIEPSASAVYVPMNNERKPLAFDLRPLDLERGSSMVMILPDSSETAALTPDGSPLGRRTGPFRTDWVPGVGT